VAGRLAVTLDIEPARPFQLRHAMQEHHVENRVVGPLLVARLEVDLRAVAGGEEERFGDLGAGQEMNQHLLRLLLAVGHLLPQLDGRAAVVRADEQQGWLLASGSGRDEQGSAHQPT